MYSSENPRVKQPVGEFMMPMVVHQMEKFKQLNVESVSVFWQSNKKVIPFRISKKIKTFNDFNSDLLLIVDGSVHQNVLITNIKGLIHKYIQKHQRIDNHLCRNCFHVSTSFD